MTQKEHEPTHHIGPELTRLLVLAKDWYDRRVQLEETIRVFGGNAQRNQEDRDDIDREAAGHLGDIVEEIERVWGFAR
jgi:hypothetical protein